MNQQNKGKEKVQCVDCGTLYNGKFHICDPEEKALWQKVYPACPKEPRICTCPKGSTHIPGNPCVEPSSKGLGKDFEEPEHAMYRKQKEEILSRDWDYKLEDEMRFLHQDGYAGAWVEMKKNAIKEIIHSIEQSAVERTRVEERNRAEKLITGISETTPHGSGSHSLLQLAISLILKK